MTVVTAEGVGTSPAPEADHPRYVYAVITKVPDPGDIGNAAIPPFDVYLDAQALGGQFTDPPRKLLDVMGADPMLALYLRTPVFTLGEIVVLDSSGEREVIGACRKPSKWSVTVEEFDDVRDAVARSQDVTR